MYRLRLMGGVPFGRESEAPPFNFTFSPEGNSSQYSGQGLNRPISLSQERIRSLGFSSHLSDKKLEEDHSDSVREIGRRSAAHVVTEPGLEVPALAGGDRNQTAGLGRLIQIQRE